MGNSNFRYFVIKSGAYASISNSDSLIFKTEKHSVHEPLKTSLQFSDLEKDANVKNDLIVKKIDDGNISFHFIDGLFSKVLSSGYHGFWKTSHLHTFIDIDLNIPEIPNSLPKSLFSKSEVKELVVGYLIESFEVGLLFIDKKFIKILEPGNYFFFKGT